MLGGNNNKQQNKVSESEALNKLNTLINQGEKSNIAAQKVAEETGYKKNGFTPNYTRGLTNKLFHLMLIKR